MSSARQEQPEPRLLQYRCMVGQKGQSCGRIKGNAALETLWSSRSFDPKPENFIRYSISLLA